MPKYSPIALMIVGAVLLGGCGGTGESQSADEADERDTATTETVFDDLIEQKDAVGPRVEAAQAGHREQLERQLSRDEGGAAPAADSDP